VTRWFLLALLLASSGCDSGDDAVDAGSVDAGVAMDAGGVDAGPADAGDTDACPGDAGPTDAGVDAAGPAPIGTITGACGELDDTELLDETMFFRFENAIDFGAVPLTEDDLARFSEGAREILDEGTAGGSSGFSEAVAFEVLARCEGAALLQSETEIVYDADGARTDMRVAIDGHPIGVSVARAVGFPREDPYPVAQALPLLMRKVEDVGESSANVAMDNDWVKQILVIVAYSPMHAESMRAAWEMIDASVRDDTILWITVTDGEDAFIYDDML